MKQEKNETDSVESITELILGQPSDILYALEEYINVYEENGPKCGCCGCPPDFWPREGAQDFIEKLGNELYGLARLVQKKEEESK